MSRWLKIKKSDPIAVALANRHYSRIAFGKQGVALGPPSSIVPGWCFRRAGWHRDRAWTPSRRDVRLYRFRSALL